MEILSCVLVCLSLFRKMESRICQKLAEISADAFPNTLDCCRGSFLTLNAAVFTALIASHEQTTGWQPPSTPREKTPAQQAGKFEVVKARRCLMRIDSKWPR